MHGFRAWLDYQLKHTDAFYRFFQTTVSFGMRVIGFFVPIDKKMILFSAHSRKYNDSPRTIYEYMINQPMYKGYKYVWALEDPEHVELPGPAIKIKADTPKYFIISMKAKYWVTCVNIERHLHYPFPFNRLSIALTTLLKLHSFDSTVVAYSFARCPIPLFSSSERYATCLIPSIKQSRLSGSTTTPHLLS